MNIVPLINTAVFLSVGFLHALRLAYQAPAVVGGITIPLWLSAIAVIGTLLLAWHNWRLLQEPGRPEVLQLLFILVLIDASILLFSWTQGLSYWGMTSASFLTFFTVDIILLILLTFFYKRTRA